MKGIIIAALLVATLSFSIKLVDIEIDGLKTVPEASISNVIESYVGKNLDLDLIKNIKEDVLETGYFQDVKVDLEDVEGGMRLVLNVEEYPTLKGWKIDIEGPELVSKEDLENSVELEKGIALNVMKVRKTLENFKNLYQDAGYFLVEFGGDMKDGVYIFKIKEYAIWDVSFEGVEGIDSKRLNEAITIKRYKDYVSMNPILKIFTDVKSYYPKISEVQSTVFKLNEMVYFESINPRFEKFKPENVEGNFVKLIFDVKLRKIVDSPVLVKKIELKNVTLLDPESLNVDLSGTVTNEQILESAQRIMDEYSRKGYMMTWVVPKFEDGTLIYDVREKFVSRITYEGLSRTRKYLLKDLITIEVGDPLKRDSLSETYANLNRSNYFQKVDIIPRTTKESTYVELVFEFQEKEKRFNFMGGIAWAPPKVGDWWMGFGGQLSLSTTNPLGYGQNGSISLNLGLEKKSLNLRYSVPRPFQMPMKFSAQTEISYTYESTETQSTETILVGGGVDLSTVPILGNVLGMGIGYDWETTNGDVRNTLKVSIFHSYDTRDSALNPRNGIRIFERFEKAGIFNLNGEDYLKVIGSLRIYHDLLWNFFFAFESYGGFVDLKEGDESIKLAFANSVRGYETLEGLYAYRASLQLKYALSGEGVPMNLLVFYDIGNATNGVENLGNFLWSSGIGLQIVLPVLGNVEIGYCYKSRTSSFDLYFTLGMMP